MAAASLTPRSTAGIYSLGIDPPTILLAKTTPSPAGRGFRVRITWGDTTCGAGTCEIKDEWLGTARARIGYAGWNNWLPYITGGAAFGGLKADNSLSGTTASKTQIGWTAGAGIEWAFRSNWSAKLEYLYADLGKFDCSTSCSLVTPDDVSFKVNLVRAGINYRRGSLRTQNHVGRRSG